MPPIKNKSHRVSILHPSSLKMLGQGHPWVTPDTFSSQFPKDTSFIIGTDKSGAQKCLLLNDPNHLKIKAWLWSMRPPFYREVENFKSELEKRLIRAFNKRIQQENLRERENSYLIFGEADFIPGLFIQSFNNHLIIQKYSAFWSSKEKILLKCLSNALIETNLFKEEGVALWMQERNLKRKKGMKKLTLPNFKNIPHKNSIIVHEYNIKFSIHFQRQYDLGLYTDMSPIRQKFSPHIHRGQKVLNLFSYTGAFTLLALKKGARVYSVDLSKRYMVWLENNIKLNQLENGQHFSLIQSCDDALAFFQSKNLKFDFIICDPPASSSDTKRMRNTFRAYENLLPKLANCLNENGKMAIFLNNHSISRSKFEKKITNILAKMPYRFTVLEKYKLSQDCRPLKGFPEGDYLKGLLLQLSSKLVSPS